MTDNPASHRNSDGPWSNTYLVKGPPRTFTDQASDAAETLLKELVNDWTDSQNLPE